MEQNGPNIFNLTVQHQDSVSNMNFPQMVAIPITADSVTFTALWVWRQFAVLFRTEQRDNWGLCTASNSKGDPEANLEVVSLEDLESEDSL